MIILLDAEKTVNKILHDLHDKGLGEISDIKNTSRHNKSNTQQDNIQHQIKWKEIQNDSSKTTNKIRLSTISISIQYRTCTSS